MYSSRSGNHPESPHEMVISRLSDTFIVKPANNRIRMYHVIRCPGCRSFTYIDHLQRWRLCPVCGEIISGARAPVYLEVEKYSEAEEIVGRLEEYLKRASKDDLTDEEIAGLRTTYARWVKAHNPT